MADSVTYEYDLNGRLKKLTFANADELNVQYDDMGNREEVEITIAPPVSPLVSGSPSSTQTTQSSAVEDDKSDSSDS